MTDMVITSLLHLQKKRFHSLDQALQINKKPKMLHAPALGKVSESICTSSLTAIMISAGKVRAGPRPRVWVLSIYFKAMLSCKKVTSGCYEAPKKARMSLPWVFCYRLFNLWGKKKKRIFSDPSYRCLHFVFNVNKTSHPDNEKSLFSPEWELELLVAPSNDLILSHSCYRHIWSSRWVIIFKFISPTLSSCILLKSSAVHL